MEIRKSKKGIIFLTEILLCAIAFGIILLYFSNTFYDVPIQKNDLSNDNLITIISQTREINTSDLSEFKNNFNHIIGKNFDVEVFLINNSCYHFNSDQNFILIPSCSISINTSKNIFSSEASLETGEVLKVNYWSKI